MKVLSYSLWGTSNKYLEGAVTNATQARKFYPEFEARFYTDNSVSDKIIGRLLEHQARVYRVPQELSREWSGLFWRFLPALDNDVTVLISRDTDSRLSNREVASVEDWLSSDAALHIMRDHPGHYLQIMGGMSGFRGRALNRLRDWLPYIFNSSNSLGYNSDQMFLTQIMSEFIASNSYINDEIFDNRSFRISRTQLEFVGESYDEFNHENVIHREILKKWLEFKAISPNSILRAL